MNGFEELGQRMGIPTEPMETDNRLFTWAGIPGAKHLTFEVDAGNRRFGYREHRQDPEVIECFFFPPSEEGGLLVAETTVLTITTRGPFQLFPLIASPIGVVAAIVYCPTTETIANSHLFVGQRFNWAYIQDPDGYTGFEEGPIILAPGHVTTRRYKAEMVARAKREGKHFFTFSG